jgi:hypothetical protein
MQTERPRAHGQQSAAKMPAGLLWGAAIALIVAAHFAVANATLRLTMLRGILLLAAAGEALGGTFGVFRPRWLAERNGRPYDPAYHGVSQDFGFYNLAFAALFTLAAFDPRRGAAVIAVAIASYTVHGATHVFRYFGLYYGGGAPLPTRPQQIELQQGLQLMAAAVGMLLFFP